MATGWSVEISETAIALRGRQLMTSSLQTAINRCLEINIRGIFEYNLNHQNSPSVIIDTVFEYIFSGSETLSEFLVNLEDSGSILEVWFRENSEYQIAFLNTLYSFVETKECYLKNLSPLLQKLYFNDFFEEDIFLEWYSTLKEPSEAFLTSSSTFVTWLKMADSD